jgi:hypothetical protein
MDTKKLAKLIKLVVEQEVKKQLPHLIKEEIAKSQKVSLKESHAKNIEIEQDPFELAEQVLQNSRIVEQKNQKQFTKNQTINEILNQTKPFSAAERQGTAGFGTTSVLDKFQSQPVNEGYSNTHIPNFMDAEPDIDGTLDVSKATAQLGLESMRAQMAAKMGYGDLQPQNSKKGGLGVTTGLAGLDRILNRDNSELVKKFKR